MQNTSFRYVTQSNIEHFKKKAAQETDPDQRKLLLMLLDKERKKLEALESGHSDGSEVLHNRLAR